VRLVARKAFGADILSFTQVARERIAAAIQDDEKTLELYQQYLRESRP
jgi:hypothetical protein